jgi:outer membrane protein assembly factor BamA
LFSFIEMRKLVAVVLLFLSANVALAQKKLIQKLLSNEKDTTRKASFLPVPLFGYAQETGFEFGLGGLYSFFVDKKDTTNRSSNFFGAAYYTTKGTYNIGFDGDAWTKGNRYHLISEFKYRKTPFNFYGVGNETMALTEDKLVQKLIRIAFDLEKKIFPSSYTGLSVAFDNQQFTDDVEDGIFQTLPATKSGGSTLFFGISQSYDTRNSNNYPTKGFFGRVSYQYAPAFFGEGNFNGSQIKVNVRNFWAIAPKIVLGAQALLHTVKGSSIPFYVLPQMGNDKMMRGYYIGRYRDENLLASQAELRYRFTNRFGIVGFAGIGKVFANSNFSLQQLKPNYGLGGRYFFDTAKGLSLRIDYGIGEKKPNEDRQKGFYIGLAEAF